MMAAALLAYIAECDRMALLTYRNGGEPWTAWRARANVARAMLRTLQARMCQWCSALATDHVGTDDAHCDAHRTGPGAPCKRCAETDALSSLVAGDPWRASNGATR